MNNGSAFTGGTADDTFVATAATAATTTLTPGDVLTGGEGTDTLLITASTAGGNTLGAGVTTASVESVSVNSVTATTLDATLMTGVTDLYSNGSLASLSVSNLSAIPNVHLVGTSADTTVAMTAATTVGTADEMTVAMSSAATTANANLTAQGIETFNVLASVASGSATTSQTLTSTSARSVAITGDASTSITVDLAGAGATAALTGSVTGNAAANTMNVTADVADFLTVDLGAGNDILILPNGIGANYTLAGGEGVNVLGLTQAGATATAAGATISDFDVLNIITAGTGTIDMDDFEGGFSKVIYDAGLGGATTVDDAVTGIEVEVDVTAVAQNLTVDLKTDGAADAITVTIDAIGAGDAIGTINAADAETLTISVDDDTTTATGTIAIAGITLGDATSVVLSGDAATTITTFTNPTTAVLTSFDASGMTDDLTMSGLNLAAAGATITLGSGDDSVTMGTGDGADTIDLSAGGDNTITYTAVGQSDAAAMDVITGFVSGSDDINLTALGVTTSSLFGGVGATRTAAEGLLGGTNSAVAVYQADDNVLWVDSNASGTLNAGDFRVQLGGVSTIAATDLGLSAAGVAITATAASAVLSTTTATNMSRVATNEGDTITSTSAFSVGSTFDGGQGTDSISFSLTAGTTTVDLDDAAGDIENIESVTIGAGILQLDLLAADLAGNAAGEIATITGVGSTAQTLSLETGGDLTDTTNTLVETISVDAAGGGTDTLTIDTANLTNVTAVTFGGAGADTLALSGGTYDFSNIAVTFGAAASVLDLNTDDNLAKTVTVDATDIANVGTITGEATASIDTVINLNDTDDISGLTITNVDTVTIAGTSQTLTIDDQDIDAAANIVDVTSTGTTNNLVVSDVGGADNAVDLRGSTISGFATITTDHGATNLTLDSESISGQTQLNGDATSIVAITETGDYTNISIDSGEYVGLVLTDGITATIDDLTLDDDGTVTTAAFAIDSTAAVDANLNIVMAGTTLNLGVVGIGATQDVDTIITGTTGNDVITMADTKAAGSAMTVTGNGGSDQFRLEDASGNVDALVVADAVSITDFDAGNDSIQFAAADIDINGIKSLASGAVTAATDGFVFINNAAVNDFSSLAQFGAAVGALTANAAGQDLAFAIANTAGDKVGIYAYTDSDNDTDVGDTAADVNLVAILDVTSGTFGLTNMGVY